MNVIYKYLDCGDLYQGFARVKCNDCYYEYLLPFSCK
ncbi:transposase zinc-binding domain-containing protein [Paenibacillus piri]